MKKRSTPTPAHGGTGSGSNSYGYMDSNGYNAPYGYGDPYGYGNSNGYGPHTSTGRGGDVVLDNSAAQDQMGDVGPMSEPASPTSDTPVLDSVPASTSGGLSAVAAARMAARAQQADGTGEEQEQSGGNQSFTVLHPKRTPDTDPYAWLAKDDGAKPLMVGQSIGGYATVEDFDGTKFLGQLHNFLDLVGFVDPFGIADGVNASIYMFEGDVWNAGISVASIFGADFLKALKVPKAVTKGMTTKQFKIFILKLVDDMDAGTVKKMLAEIDSTKALDDLADPLPGNPYYHGARESAEQGGIGRHGDIDHDDFHTLNPKSADEAVQNNAPFIDGLIAKGEPIRLFTDPFKWDAWWTWDAALGKYRPTIYRMELGKLIESGWQLAKDASGNWTMVPPDHVLKQGEQLFDLDLVTMYPAFKNPPLPPGGVFRDNEEDSHVSSVTEVSTAGARSSSSSSPETSTDYADEKSSDGYGYNDDYASEQSSDGYGYNDDYARDFPYST